MDQYTLIGGFLTATLLGSLIGIERERQKSSTGGIRTFALIGALGFCATIDSNLFWLIGMSVFALLCIAYAIDFWKRDNGGLTSEFALIGVFVAGVMIGYDLQFLAITLTIVSFLFLHHFDGLKKFATTLDSDELTGTVKLAIIALIILPLLPDQAMGPLNAFNPYDIWKMVVFISGLGRVGYILTKIFGSKYGIGLTSIMGGLASSTAVTTTLSTRSTQTKGSTTPFVFGTVIASTIMFIRMGFAVSVFNQTLFNYLLPSLSAMAVTGCVLSAYRRRQQKNEPTDSVDLDLGSPFEIKPALIFGGLFALIGFVSTLGITYLPEQSLYLIAIISGFADVDAITLSIASLPELTSTIAIGATLLAATSNTIVKGFLAYKTGERRYGIRVVISFALIIIAGFVTRFATSVI